MLHVRHLPERDFLFEPGDGMPDVALFSQSQSNIVRTDAWVKIFFSL